MAEWNICTILWLIADEKADRDAAKKFRELWRKLTYNGEGNKCDFDVTDDEKKREQIQKRIKKSPIHEGK